MATRKSGNPACEDDFNADQDQQDGPVFHQLEPQAEADDVDGGQQE